MKWAVIFSASWFTILADGFIFHITWPSFIAFALMIFSLLKFGEESE